MVEMGLSLEDLESMEYQEALRLLNTHNIIQEEEAKEKERAKKRQERQNDT